jgi:effector-binding domain-containing protein
MRSSSSRRRKTRLQGAFGELQATLTAQNLPAGGNAGGIFADDVFTNHLGQVTIFVPCAGLIRPVGRVVPLVVPAVELAVITHSGPPADADRAYGTLTTYVARHALAVDGPIREYYLVGQSDTADTSRWRTEIAPETARIRWALLADVSAETSHAIAPGVSAETSAARARARPADQAIRGPGALAPGRGCGGVRSSMVRSGNMTAPSRYGRMLVLFVRG